MNPRNAGPNGRLRQHSTRTALGVDKPKRRTATRRAQHVAQHQDNQPAPDDGTPGVVDRVVLSSTEDAATRDAQLSAIFESMADAVIFYDRTGRFVKANPAFYRLLNLQARPDYTALPLAERGRLLLPRDEFGEPLPENQWLPFRVLRGEVLTGTNAVDFMIRPFGRDDVLLSGSGAPVRDSTGTTVGCVLILRDVTERRRLERHTHEALQALLAMAERLVSDQTTASLEHGIAVAAGAGAGAGAGVAQRLAELTQTVLACQRVTIVPIGPGDEVQETWAVAGPITAEERQQWQANWPKPGQRHLHDFLPSDIITRLRLQELIPVDRWQPPFNRWPNPLHWRSMLAVPMVLGRHLIGVLTLDYGAEPHAFTPGELALAGGVARLATLVLERERLLNEREEARASTLALQEANRRMDEFLGIATHELRTPVTSSGLTVGLAALRLASVLDQATARGDELTGQLESIQELLVRADSGMERLSRLVSDLLDVSRIRAGRLDMHMAACDLATIVREAVAEQQQIAPDRTILLHVPAKGIVAVQADADRIGQVVTNYLTNALKYSAAERPVEVQLQWRKAWVHVAVRDEGPGVPRSEQRRIWERYHRVAGAQVASGTGIGLGLGLHICKTIIERHRGRVGLRSVPGKGSTFWFTLPLVPDNRDSRTISAT